MLSTVHSRVWWRQFICSRSGELQNQIKWKGFPRDQTKIPQQAEVHLSLFDVTKWIRCFNGENVGKKTKNFKHYLVPAGFCYKNTRKGSFSCQLKPNFLTEPNSRWKAHLDGCKRWMLTGRSKLLLEFSFSFLSSSNILDLSPSSWNQTAKKDVDAKMMQWEAYLIQQQILSVEPGQLVIVRLREVIFLKENISPFSWNYTHKQSGKKLLPRDIFVSRVEFRTS